MTNDYPWYKKAALVGAGLAVCALSRCACETVDRAYHHKDEIIKNFCCEDTTPKKGKKTKNGKSGRTGQPPKTEQRKGGSGKSSAPIKTDSQLPEYNHGKLPDPTSTDKIHVYVIDAFKGKGNLDYRGELTVTELGLWMQALSTKGALEGASSLSVESGDKGYFAINGNERAQNSKNIYLRHDELCGVVANYFDTKDRAPGINENPAKTLDTVLGEAIHAGNASIAYVVRTSDGNVGTIIEKGRKDGKRSAASNLRVWTQKKLGEDPVYVRFNECTSTSYGSGGIITEFVPVPTGRDNYHQPSSGGRVRPSNPPGRRGGP